jgi:hypothetical protein
MHYIEDQSILAAFEEEEFVDPTPRKLEDGREIYLSRMFGFPSTHGESVLCDFGSAVYGSKVNDREAYPQVYRCPEVMLHTTWTYSADIRNGGAMVSAVRYKQSERPNALVQGGNFLLNVNH